MRTTTLICVSAAGNHNKFYRLTELSGGGVRAEWGRVGSAGQSTVYDARGAYDTKLAEKLWKGYVEASADAAAIDEAAGLLTRLEQAVTSGGSIPAHAKERYLEICPQRVSDVYANDWLTPGWFTAQRSLLSALRALADAG